MPDGYLLLFAGFIAASNVLILRNNSPASHHKTVVYRSEALAQKGVWHTFKAQVRWSPDPDGRLRMWINGEQVVDYAGPIGYGMRWVRISRWDYTGMRRRIRL